MAWSVASFALLTILSVVPALLVLPARRCVALVLVASAFFVAATLGVRRYERSPTAGGASTVFGAQLALAAGAIVVSNGQAKLLVFGTLSQAVFFLGFSGATLVSAACLGLMLLADRLAPLDLVTLERYLPAYSAPFGFVVAFSWAIRIQLEMQAKQRRLAKELREANEQLRKHAREAGALAADRERLRIARDIHDSVGHCLTNTHIQLELAATLLDRDTERVRSAVDAAASSTREALGEVRRSVAALRDGPPASLVDGITALVDRVRATGVPAELTVEGAATRLAPPVEIALFHVAQEALTNVQRHAHATRVEIRLEFRADAVALHVRDDGVGRNGSVGSGFGLRTMQERLQEVDGTLEAGSPEDGGFVVAAEIPRRA